MRKTVACFIVLALAFLVLAAVQIATHPTPFVKGAHSHTQAGSFDGVCPNRYD